MRIHSLDHLLEEAKQRGTKVLSVACAHDKEVLKAVEAARREGIIRGILVGKKEEIRKLFHELNYDLSHYTIINSSDDKDASRKAVELVSNKTADIVMKGSVETSILLKAVLDKEIGLRTGKVLSHVSIVEIKGFDKLFYITDGGMNMYPDVMTKAQIIENSAIVAHALGNDNPKAAVIAAIEKVNPKMPATVDAKELEEMYQLGKIKGCEVGGPFGLDNAISMFAARQKKMSHPLAGKADILVVPYIEVGNVLYKSIMYFANAISASIVVGAKAPIIVTSRSDTKKTKFNSIALSTLVSTQLKD